MHRVLLRRFGDTDNDAGAVQDVRRVIENRQELGAEIKQTARRNGRKIELRGDEMTGLTDTSLRPAAIETETETSLRLTSDIGNGNKPLYKLISVSGNTGK